MKYGCQEVEHIPGFASHTCLQLAKGKYGKMIENVLSPKSAPIYPLQSKE